MTGWIVRRLECEGMRVGVRRTRGERSSSVSVMMIPIWSASLCRGLIPELRKQSCYTIIRFSYMCKAEGKLHIAEQS